MNRKIKTPALPPHSIAFAFVAAGFVFMVLGWWGSARLDYVQGQIPYLISGGVVGLGLVGAGIGYAVLHQQREVARRLEEVADALGARHPAGNGNGNGHGNGHGNGSLASGSAVIAGPTVYHKLGCKLVEGRADLPIVTPAEAAEHGLEPCRVCGPREAQPRKSSRTRPGS